MPASAVAKRTPSIGLTFGSALGANGEIGAGLPMEESELCARGKRSGATPTRSDRRDQAALASLVPSSRARPGRDSRSPGVILGFKPRTQPNACAFANRLCAD